MRKTFNRYGLYGGVTVIVLYIIDLLIFSDKTANYSIAEVFGYATIIISLCFVYFGIRYYRDKQNNGMLSFWRGIKTGMLITLIPAVCFGLADVIYITVIDPAFYDKATSIGLLRLKATVPAADYAAKAVAFKEQMDFFRKPPVDFALMFITVAAVGLIITVISTFMLKRAAATKTTVEFA